MYTAPHFRPTSIDEAFAVVEAHPFALLVSQADGRPLASHTPMLADGSEWLIGHLARANPQWRSLDGQDVLCVFSGPHAHVTPTWYASGPAVPTWDYVAAHVHGRAELLGEPGEVEAALRRLTGFFEGAGWRFDDQPADYLAGMMKGVVAFRVRVEGIQANLKLSQNRSVEDRAGIVRGLRARQMPGDREIARLVEARESPG
ncbi:MAG TPA: FMN-binding negative transcriptional regulator [Geminicoccaceae bacterium]